MAARSTLLAEVDSLRKAVDLPILIDTTVDARVRNKLIAGIAITAFISFEQFFRERAGEIAAYISTGSTHYQDLSPAARKTLLLRTGRTFVATLQRGQSTETDWIAAATAVGNSMTSIGSSPLNIAAPTLAWAGSNLQESDIEEVLQILGCVDKPWEALTAVLKRGLRSNTAVPAKDLFKLVAGTRHSAAHSAQPATTVTELRTLPRTVLLLSLATDVLLSHLALEVQRGRLAALPASTHRVARFRYVENRSGHWRHIAENRKKGKRFPTRDDAWSAATQAAGTDEETVVELDAAGDPTTWIPAFCP